MKKVLSLGMLVFLVSLLVMGNFTPTTAEETVCTTAWDGDLGQFVTTCTGGSPGGGEPGECISSIVTVEQILPSSIEGICLMITINVDVCTGEVAWTNINYDDYYECTVGEPTEHPCTEFICTSGNITCGTDWFVTASVSFPEIFFDARPYPASLVRWPTAVRNGGLPPASGSGTYDYIAYGGGSAANPAVGDWQNLKLTLSLKPAGAMYVYLPQVGSLILPPGSATSQPRIIQWELPSHPAAGGTTLAGSVAGLGELPADMPLFVGYGRAPYRLFWQLTYEEYTHRKECESGSSGGFNCRLHGSSTEDDGHWEHYYEWKPRSKGGEIHPSQVQGLPASLAADLNNDGVPDAYWDNNLTIRRMNDSNFITGHWAASWNWGGTIYWGVREGQGQIGWPGNP